MTEGTDSLPTKCKGMCREAALPGSQGIPVTWGPILAQLQLRKEELLKVSVGVLAMSLLFSPVLTPNPHLSLPVLMREQGSMGWGMVEEAAVAQGFTLVIRVATMAAFLCVLSKTPWSCFETLLTPYGNIFLDPRWSRSCPGVMSANRTSMFL